MTFSIQSVLMKDDHDKPAAPDTLIMAVAVPDGTKVCDVLAAIKDGAFSAIGPVIQWTVRTLIRNKLVTIPFNGTDPLMGERLGNFLVHKLTIVVTVPKYAYRHQTEFAIKKKYPECEIQDDRKFKGDRLYMA